MIPFAILVPPETRNRELIAWLFATAIKTLNLKHVVVRTQMDPAFETLFLPNEIVQSALSAYDFNSFHPDLFSFTNEGVICNGEFQDELFTAFFLINCLQEYHSKAVDPLGRFKFSGSYQEKFKKIKVNFVAELFKRYFVRHFAPAFRNAVSEKSVFFFSHDIDSVYGALMQDGFAAVKKGRIDIISKLILNTAFLKPEWFNIDKIMKIDSEYDLRSTFFWIVNQGKASKTTTNADYSIRSEKVQNTMKDVREKGHFLGLHKSISEETFDEEKAKLNYPTVINRNHYLKFSLPDHFDQLERSSLKIDCSLGFAEHYGFRNSLAIPFIPVDLKTLKPYHFLEVPLNIMDGTFQKYMKTPPKLVAAEMIDFIEKNRSNSVISVLWHNHFFSSFRFEGYFKPYIELLDYLKKHQYQSISPDQLFNKFYFTL